jgi:hypothetical protein
VGSNNARSQYNPTIASYNASAVKIYNATSGLVGFENKTKNRFTVRNALAYYNTGVVEKGLAPGVFRLF